MLNREELDVSRKKIHCQPCNSPFPSNLSNAAPSNGETAAPPNIPKKKTAMRLVNSSLVYHVERVYIAAGIYPASEKPKMLRCGNDAEDAHLGADPAAGPHLVHIQLGLFSFISHVSGDSSTGDVGPVDLVGCEADGEKREDPKIGSGCKVLVVASQGLFYSEVEPSKISGNVED
ncbi:hypothetical protein An12g02870 [Aspergillus niger]|uniref:Uncharacterized protein n=2 Tax=Aspergillus niger TaxID=5061 RepID=A2QYX7_ASPNC|nr:hypothetical protein An12g02870 [Aspergillus niger]CAK41126.1 hypothetical protein An12g02870 [Aspergillus niger]